MTTTRKAVPIRIISILLSLAVVLMLVPWMGMKALADGTTETYTIVIEDVEECKQYTYPSAMLPISIGADEILNDLDYSGFSAYSTMLTHGTNVAVSGNTVTVNGAGVSKIAISMIGNGMQIKIFDITVTADSPAHTHTWSVTASGATATVKCTAADCPYTTRSGIHDHYLCGRQGI